tara:strand:- start:10 stop:264 length:255 start_codon:yes stop_codon:yes gene_type:complete
MLEDYAQPERRKFASQGWIIVDDEHFKQYGAYSHGYLINYNGMNISKYDGLTRRVVGYRYPKNMNNRQLLNGQIQVLWASDGMG